MSRRTDGAHAQMTNVSYVLDRRSKDTGVTEEQRVYFVKPNQVIIIAQLHLSKWIRN